ncbi:putative Acetate--CoA ligase [Planktothrix rubescens CCAP 1459/22]|uniref:Acetate--CoA ligase n=1 Tax=Planktothrix rubescens CCAP 1459/22 TaxID=329571 RepID=A0A6J7ZQY9_PLARU|nr:non-ribosomal peptide synthetase [Planktothrix rubescens]CAC5344912.1 putative Acetate--CoA ligase [Planktothrix rubescens NIVA-CYA 18]
MPTIPALANQKIAITATFTSEPVEDSLSYWLKAMGFPDSIEFAQYNQVFQELLNPSSLLATNHNGVNVILVRFEDWQETENRLQPIPKTAVKAEFFQNENSRSRELGENITQIEQTVQDFANALKTATTRSPNPHLVCICPPSPTDEKAFNELHEKLQEQLEIELQKNPSICLIKSQELLRTYPVQEYYDPYGDELGHIPYNLTFFTALGTILARKILALKSSPYKVIALDCDNTLWNGICGEDGVKGVKINAPFRALQEFIIAQQATGKLICLCSKNQADDVFAVFEQHPDMLLKRNHLVNWRINWQEKSQNLQSLAEELQLGLDSFIFIDDNPIECAEVRANCPEVLTLQLPQESEKIPQFLAHIWAFDQLQTTQEDQQRTNLYQQNIQRQRLQEDSLSFEDFLAQLNLEIEISPVQKEELTRVAQLTQRTNQFNLTTIRRSESQIKQLCNSGELDCRGVKVKDRFGDYGLVGLLLFTAQEDSLIVDTFLLSCRVLGRGVEHQMLAYLGTVAQEKRLAKVELFYKSTPKNKPICDFLTGIEKGLLQEKKDGVLFEFSAQIASETIFSPRSNVDSLNQKTKINLEETTAKSDSLSYRILNYQFFENIAQNLCNPELILQEIACQQQRQRQSDGEFVAPRTPLEKAIASLFIEVLKLDRVGIDDDFFVLGGDSLQATQLISRIRTSLKVELPLPSIFTATTVTTLAQEIEQWGQKNLELTALTILPRTGDAQIPLSYAQQRLWFLDQFQPNSALYNIPLALRLEGNLNQVALEQALQTIIERHEALRTNFLTIEGKPTQIIQTETNWTISIVHPLQPPRKSEREITCQQLINTQAIQPFDLATEPLIRVTLLTLSQTEQVLLVCMHHVVSDGWSMGVFVQELAVLYNAYTQGKLSPLAPLPIQYADFALWQRQWLQEDVLETQLAYWQKQLAGATTFLPLPTDKPRPAVQTFVGAHQEFILSPELSQKLTKLSQEQGVTLFMTLFAAFDVLLYRYTGQTDILVGTPIANRNHSEIEGLIGFFVNTLVLRTNLAENSSFEQLLAQVREVALEAYSHQDLPFEMLVEALQPERDISYTPLFQVMFVLQNTPLSTVELTGLSISSVQVETNTAKFDLSLAMENTDAGLVGVWEYNTDLFSPDTIERMTGHFLTLLEGIVTNQKETLAELPLLTQLEQKQLLIEWNNTQVDYPVDKCIHQLFEEQVERTPDAVAVTYENESLTYRELNNRANQLAHYLRQNYQIKPDTLVGICVERSLEMIIGILGILKAGAAYLPLDPEYPPERLQFILEDSGILLLLTQGFLKEKLLLTNLKNPNQILYLDEQSFSPLLTDNPSSQTKTDSLAYVIYTSGSTGKPKGVMIENRSIVNLALAWSDVFQIQNHSRVLQFGSLSFDLSIGEIATALAAGASLYLAQKETLLPSQILVDLLTENQISHAFLSPSALSVLPQATLSNLQSLTVGGEACTAKLITEWSKGRNFFNAYGPTETTVCATVARFTKDEEKVSIGRPVSNTQIYILDSYLQPVPIGVPGELHIGGAGLARSYLNRPELTQEKFIPNPFSNYPDSRLYKTGDLARYLPDGNIEYLGRIDNQVKIRGFRIELGEIETVLTQNPQVQSSVIIACEDTPGNKRLVAYIVPQKDATPTPNELRQFLKEKLPEYMIPSAFVILESLPLTPNGKIDRRALPEPEQSYERTDKFILPRNPIEEILVTIWSEVLKVKQVSINDNFFELGGHSLLATQLISRIRTNLQIEIPLRSLFAAPTIEELGQQIQQLQQQDLTLSAPPILPRGEQSELLLSYAQTRLWFLDQLETNSAFYNIPVALRLQGHLNQAALIQSLEEIIQRHEALRTNFVNVNGQPTQVIQTVTNWTVSVINLQHLSPEEQEIAATNLVKGESFKPFDLANEALVRATLIVLNNNEYWLLLCLHHVISDGWSMGVFIEELTALYNAYNQGQPSPLKPLPIQYADFAVWQRQWLQGEVLENQLNYWQKQLADAPTFLPLPTDKPRPVIQTFTGAYQEFQLSLELTQKLTQLSQQQGVTMFMTLLAVYGTLLYRYTGQSDILIGTPIANRNRREIESLIGFFVNTLVMRTDCSENPSFQELLMRVREMSLGAYAHQDLPFEMLVEALQPERNLSHTPLFQVMFVLQNTPLSEVEMSGLTVNSLPLEGETAKFDLTLSMQNTETGLMGVWEYNTDLFNSETIERMNGHFMTLLEGIIANPRERVSQLPLLTKVEQQQLLIDWNNTEVDYPDDKCIHQLFEEQVERTPNAVAVVFEGQQLTYNELNCRTNQLAHYLQSLGVKADELVGICVERSLEMIVGLLGILKAGGAYVPLDPEYPLERLSFMLEDAAVNVLLTQQKLINKLPEHQAQLICLDADWELIFQFSRDNLITDIQATNLAYVIYTSGSTGQPKGVMLSHSNLSNHMFWMQETFPLTRADRVLQKTSFSFDASVWEFYAPLLVGGQLLIAQPGGHTDSDYLLKTIAQQQVTTVQLVPSLLQMLLEQGGIENCQLLKRVFCGGEILPVALQEKLFSQLNVNLCNLYGPTECCIDVTFWNCQREMYGQRIPSFQELLMRVREMSLGAYAHQDLPFEMLVEALQPERNLSHTPLFQVMFVLQNTPLSEVEMSGLTVNSLPLEGETAKFDLTLSMQNTETGLMGVWEYNTDLFNSETIERMNGHFMTLLEGIIANPRERVSQLPLLTKVEQQQLLIDWNNTEVDYPDDKCIHQLFEEQVERTPNAVAVVFEGQQLTYNELNCRANQLAHYLQSLGIKPDELVGIGVERSLEMIVGLLGILKAGGAYVPLDPKYPLERISFMLEDSQVKVLVTQAKLVESIPQHQAQLICLDTDWEKIAQNITSNPESGVKPDNLTYIIYTSGSTGKPKGVLVNHANVVRLFAATDSWYHFNYQDVWTLFHSYAFDFSVWEMWGALLYGGRLVIVPYLVTRSPESFYELLCQEKVTILNQTPTAFRQLIQAEESVKGDISPLLREVGKDSVTETDLSLRLVIFGGESLEINSLQPWFDRHGDQLPQLVNMYGITETTVHVTYRPLSMADVNSTASVIGRPLPDLQVYLLDQYLQPVPVGVPGEMYVGGAGVAKGYLNRPELTTERFISSPFDPPLPPLNKGGTQGGAKLYKTGDLARYLPNGELEYLGRIDNQVKIRGFRIELGEIEALLASHPQIWETVVLVWDDTAGDKRLVAYIVPQPEITIIIDEIRQFLKAKLPDYMVPNAFVILEALPLTTNGKIDRRALPPPESGSEVSDKYVAPRTPMEEILATIWSEVLKVEKVGINDNFFELGGHSLLATQLVAQIRDRLKIELPLRQLFNTATLAELAQGIEQLKQQKLAPIVTAILPRRRK